MKKAVAWLLFIAVAVALYKMPGVVESSIPSIYYVTPSTKTYESIVSCTGTVQAETVHEIYVESPSLPEQIAVSVGDSVHRGDFLTRLFPLQTALSYSSPLSLLNNSSSSLISSEVDWASFAALYGLGSITGGGMTDYSDLTELLELLVEQEISTISSQTITLEQENIYAPANGIVTSVNLRENVPAIPGIAVFTISEDSGYKVLAAVSESDVYKVGLGDEVKVRCSGYPGKVYTGVVIKIHPTAHKILRGTTTETVVDVEIRLANADANLKPGFTAKVEIMGGQDQQLITVPYEAIRQDDNNDEYVYTYEDGKIVKNLVITGQELTNEVEILEGLTIDSIVVYNPGDIVKEGAMIHLKGRANVD